MSMNRVSCYLGGNNQFYGDFTSRNHIHHHHYPKFIKISDEYSPDEYHEISDYIIIPVYVKTFKKNNGEIGHSFAVQQQFGSARGEHF